MNRKLYCTFTFTMHPGPFTGLRHPGLLPGHVFGHRQRVRIDSRRRLTIHPPPLTRYKFLCRPFYASVSTDVRRQSPYPTGALESLISLLMPVLRFASGRQVTAVTIVRFVSIDLSAFPRRTCIRTVYILAAVTG
jgi:hypothetical protein